MARDPQSADRKSHKIQLKIRLNQEVYAVLRKLCEKSRRSPAGQIEFMTLMFSEYDLEQSLIIPRKGKEHKTP